MTRYKPSDLARLGPDARRQIELARFAATARAQLKAEQSNKFNAKPTTVDGIRFASKTEADRYAQLKVLQRVGRITELVCHPEFPIIVNGIKIASYFADFEYYDDKGSRIIEDVKSKPTKTPLYRLKKKLVECLHGILIVEIER